MAGLNTRQDEGVSEAIGFIIIFGLVITGIGLITLYGYPMLTQQQSNADVRNMEQTMVVLQNDIKSLCYKNVPYKETALQVSGGSLMAENSSETVQNFTISGNTINKVFSPGMLLYDSDSQDATIALENGGVIRAQSSGSTMLAEPRWYLDDASSTMVINLINLTTSGTIARSGMGSVRMKLAGTETEIDDSGGINVTVTYTPDATANFSKAWENYLTGSLGMNKIAPNTYQITTDNLIVKTYEVQVLSV
ncbi:DUF7289 family protein [Methanofollis fontis]|uniref:Uncharacterized protein n=1 Tax=Methanofollis fontis TaxID=2052832 RepID=A0A483CV85_9EURY|nr:hypothetical protein [Methanofollis fontis]TAJ45391.1 hypothetical protein CUJ86_01205 [Methanofollis fontis]